MYVLSCVDSFMWSFVIQRDWASRFSAELQPNANVISTFGTLPQVVFLFYLWKSCYVLPFTHYVTWQVIESVHSRRKSNETNTDIHTWMMDISFVQKSTLRTYISETMCHNIIMKHSPIIQFPPTIANHKRLAFSLASHYCKPTFQLSIIFSYHNHWYKIYSLFIYMQIIWFQLFDTVAMN